MIKREIQIFFTALAFFTRIPCHSLCNYSPETIIRANKYLSVIGWIVGALGGIVFCISGLFFPASISILLAMISMIMLTGGFHEDGFADFCDGVGGSTEKAKILEIMKDSRVGSFALIGMIFLLGLKYMALININPYMIPFVLIAGNSLSRFVNGSFIFTHDYLRKEDITSKSMDMTQERMPLTDFIIMAVTGLAPLLLLGLNSFIVLIPVFVTRQIFAKYLQEKLGGYTGDCLGAIQQISEVVFYVFMVVIAPCLST